MHSFSTRQAPFRFFLITIACLSLLGCTVRLVPVYDQRLVTETDALFRRASAIIDAGWEVSPKTDADRAAITPPESSPAHYSAFASSYNALQTDADALILRALVGSHGVSPVGETLEKSITALIDGGVPSQCAQLEAEFAQYPGLTLKNFVDLKCILVRWKAQHDDATLTLGTRILKRANWEGRKRVLFDAILAIQKAEMSKKDE